MPGRFPDLICIGAQKAATTWLYEMLRRRPQFYLPALKELHYFTQIHQPEIKFPRTHRANGAERIRKFLAANPNAPKAGERLAEADLLGQAEVDDEWYGSLFAGALPEQICAEACPSYLHLPKAGIEHLLGLNPSVRLVLFVRDPVDRAWSHIRMNLGRGTVAGVDALLSGSHSTKQYVEQSEYRNSMTLWRSLATPGQLNVFLYDNVEADPASVISRVHELVGLPAPADFGAVNKRVHESAQFAFPKELRAKLLEQLAPQYDFLSAEFPEAVSRWLTKHRAALA